MSALTPIRRPATPQAIALIVAHIKALTFETEDAATLLDEIDTAMNDSLYASFGTISLSDAANDMRAEVKAFELEADQDQDDDFTCSACNGCGEGQHEGAACWKCKGRGEVSLTERFGVLL